MNFRYNSRAESELWDAALYYESHRPELGIRFLNAVDAGLAAILDHPRRWPEIDAGIRRYRLERFPYALVYRQVADDVVEIIAVTHLRRRPGYWQDRLEQA